MKKSNRIIFITLLTLFNIFYLAGCTCTSCSQDNAKVAVPDSIFSVGDKFIISKAGEEFFSEFIHRDFLNSKEHENFYELIYRFKIIDKEFIDEKIQFFVDKKGNVLQDHDIIGIPDCWSDSRNCEFNIDKNKAVEIASENNLEEGIRDWDVSFRWSAEHGKYVWHILTTIGEIGSGDFYKANGKEIFIHPYDGSVIQIRSWRIN